MDLAPLLACPLCRTPLWAQEGGYCCQRCGAFYPIREGIPCLFPPAPGAARANQALFDGIADTYEHSLPAHVVGHYLEKRVRFLRARQAPGIALEVGCGTGLLATRLATAGFPVVGLDASLGMLRHLKQRGGMAVAGFSDALPFLEGSFSLAFSVATLHHLAEPALVGKTLAEMVRAVARGGEVILWDHNPLNPYWSVLMRRMPQDAGPTRLVPAAEIAAHLESQGACVTQLRRLGFVPDFTPRRLLPAMQGAEGLLERLPLVRRWAAHNVVVARKV